MYKLWLPDGKECFEWMTIEVNMPKQWDNTTAIIEYDHHDNFKIKWKQSCEQTNVHRNRT